MTCVHYGENKPGTPSNKLMTTEPFLRDLDAEFSCKAAVRTDTLSDSMMSNQCGQHLSDHRIGKVSHVGLSVGFRNPWLGQSR